MQQFILIPEVPAIVRKISHLGEHWAFFGKGEHQRAEDSYRRLLNGERTEHNYTWTSYDFHEQGRKYNLKFLPETSNG